MASQTQGIQQLLAAEKRAAEKVFKSKMCFAIWTGIYMIYMVVGVEWQRGKTMKIKTQGEKTKREKIAKELDDMPKIASF